ncbi:hypothetical protein [Sporomusa sp.]|uniref:hypothetical protein n=1 Tax=Sporomusa sp. TaxID=2078658 RepID=UPI002D7F4CDC|nr:hypothetical protein [Sporomusa sp.]
MQIDLLPFMAKAIAKNAAARRELDIIYADGIMTIEGAASSRWQKYYNYYRESDLVTELYCHKATALILISLNNDENSKKAAAALEQLLKKCWPPLYTYIKASGEEVSFDPFWLDLAKKEGKATLRELRNLPQLTKRMEQNPHLKQTVKKKSIFDGDFVMFLYLANLFKKTIKEQGQAQATIYIHICVKHLEEQERMIRRKKPPVLTSKQKELADTLWQSIDQKLRGIPASLTEYFNILDANRCRLEKENFSGLPLDALGQVIVSRQSLKSAIETMVTSLPDETTATAELKQAALELFTRTLCIRACAAEYEKVRSLAFQYVCLEEKAQSKPAQEKRDKEQLEQAQKKILALEQVLAQKQTMLNELQLKINKKEIADQREREQLQEKLDDINQVFISLLAAEKQQNDPKHEVDFSQETMEKIALLKVIIIGGRTVWQQRLKQKYPSFGLISSEDVKFDLSILDAADVIVISWKCLGHSLFYRTVHYASKHNKKIVYLGSSNERQLLQALYYECILPIEASNITAVMIN